MVCPSEGRHERSVRLVEAIRAGDTAAWEELIDAYGPLVVAVARRRGLSEAEAQDVFQETWASLLTQIHTLRQPQALVSWIARTARRQATFARRGRGGGWVDDAGETLAASSEGSPLEDLVDLEVSTIVREQALLLGEPCRTVLHALFFEAERPDYGELARRIDRSVDSIGPTRRRCLAALGERLERRGLR